FGIGGLAPQEQWRAETGARRKLGLDGVGRRYGVARASPIADQVGQGVQSALGRTVPREQLGKGHGADAVGPGEPEAGETLCLRQGRHAFFAPILGSAPLSRRPMFSWWRMKISTAVKTARTRMGGGAGRPSAGRGSRAYSGVSAAAARADSEE